MKNQKTQMVILGCLIALVLGLGVFKVMGGNKPNAGPQKQQAAVVEQSTQASPDESSESAEVADASVAAEVTSKPAYNVRDPFVPQVIEGTGSRPNTGQTGPPPLVATMPRLPLPMVSALSPQPIDFNPASQANTEPAPDPASTLRLTGVVEGSCNLAIIRGDEGARYIVREGQSIDGMYVVQSISRSGVRLRFGGKTYVLTLGSPPKKK